VKTWHFGLLVLFDTVLELSRNMTFKFYIRVYKTLFIRWDGNIWLQIYSETLVPIIMEIGRFLRDWRHAIWDQSRDYCCPVRSTTSYTLASKRPTKMPKNILIFSLVCTWLLELGSFKVFSSNFFLFSLYCYSLYYY